MSDPQDKTPNTAPNGDTRAAFSGQPDDLHNLIAVPPGADSEDPLAALRDDPNYAALIRDLETIAQAARDLFKPTEEAPSDGLWAKIQSQLPTKPDA